MPVGVSKHNTVEDAENRYLYLAGFDDNWLLNDGFHTVIGTLVVRTSKELLKEKQAQLESDIIDVLTGGEVGDAIPSTLDETDEKIKSELAPNKDKESEETSGKIVMPYSTEDYIGSEWTIETITEHFEELGFTNIRAVPYDPDDDNYKINIREMVIETGWFSTDPWEVGDEFNPDAEISIYYNEFPLLTIENCTDLITVLTSKEMDYMIFCNKYDGRYVEFDAYIVSHITYDGGTSHIIDLAGGDYDGQTELPSSIAGHYVRIGDRTWENSIDKDVEVGDHVIVSGRIDASWADYFKCLYVETMDLRRR